MKNRISILYIFGTDPLGGVGSYLKNIINYINRDTFDISFLFFSDTINDDFDTLLKRKNINYYVLNNFTLKNLTRNMKGFENIVKANHFQIIHVHSPNLSSFVDRIAKKNDIRIRIVHAHSVQSSNSFVKRIRNRVLMIPMNYYATNFWGCNNSAIDYYYGKDCRNRFVAINGIDTIKFKYNIDLRNKLRDEYHIDSNCLVVGHVGRFAAEKNHKFIIELANTAKKQGIKLLFFLIGDGEMKTEIQSIIAKDSLDEYFIFAGQKSNVEDYYNVFDAFILPSLFEGSPLSIIEAYSNGLSTIVSERIPTDLFRNDMYTICNLSDQKQWLDQIFKSKRNMSISSVDVKKFDINTTIHLVEEEYIRYVKENY